MQAMDSIARSDWDEVVASFRLFFAELGTVVADGDTASFAAPQAGTGLVLGRDGTSSSFMPLHGLTADWDRVTFDREELTVTVSGDGFSYTYRVPPALQTH
jgi:hypothetical protein